MGLLSLFNKQPVRYVVREVEIGWVVYDRQDAKYVGSVSYSNKKSASNAAKVMNGVAP